MGMPAEITRKRFTVDEYHRMGEAGVFESGIRVELIDGEVFQMTPIGSRHAAAVMRLDQAFHHAFAGRTTVSAQLPLVLDDYSEPEPDLALLAVRGDFYASKLPSAPDAVLVVEVSMTSLRFDRELKLPRYAEAGVPEVWIFDLAEARLHVYRQPVGDTYTDCRTLGRDDTVEVEAFPGTPFIVSDLIG